MVSSLSRDLETSFERHANSTAILDRNGLTISYGKLRRNIDRLSGILARAGVARGDLVACNLKSPTDHVTAVLAVSQLGAVATPLPPLETDVFEPSHVFGETPPLPRPNSIRPPNFIQFVSVPPSSSVDGRASSLFSSDDDAEMALIIPTSGTTGRRKFLAFSPKLFDQAIKDQAFFVGELSRRTLITVSPKTVFGLEMVLNVLLSGGQIIWPQDKASTEAQLMLNGLVDDAIATPAWYAYLAEALRERNLKIGPMNTCVIAGSVASRRLLTLIQERICPNLYNQYGSSELGPCARSHVDVVANIENGVGRIAPWLEVKILDDTGNQLPRGEVGNLHFRLGGNRQVIPFLGRDSAKLNVPVGGWYAPGDRGTLRDDDILCISGRTSDMINTGGNKFSASFLTDKIALFIGALGSAHVFGLQTPNGYDEIVVVVESMHSAKVKQLREFLKRFQISDADYRVVLVRRLPLNEFGKVDLPALQRIASLSRSSAEPSGG